MLDAGGEREPLGQARVEMPEAVPGAADAGGEHVHPDREDDAMRGGAEVLGAGTPAGKRLAESAMYFEFVSKELPLLLDRWADYKAAHRH
jgi:hypothetical protein